MTLSSIIVSKDWPEVSVLECILGGMQIDVEVEARPSSARAKLATSKFDALIIDCDLEGTDEVLTGLRLRPNQDSMPVAFMSRKRVFPKKQPSCASFVLQKPISVEEAVHTLSAARNSIVRGRLRYHRATLDMPVWLTCGTGKRVDAKLFNLSQGGVAICTRKPVPTKGTLEVNFALPGNEDPLKDSGKVVWTDGDGKAGIKFVGIDPRAKKHLQIWLEQKYFAS